MIAPLRLLRGHGAIVTGLVAQILQYGAALALLPFLVTRQSTAEVAVWNVFVTLQTLVMLADFGFQPTIGRAIASAYAGVASIQRKGLAAASQDDPNLPLIRAVIQAAQRLYLGLSIVTLAVLLTVGTPYVLSLVEGAATLRQDVRTAWFIWSLGTAANLYFLWVSPLLIGSGRVAQNYVMTIISRGGFALAGIAVLLGGGGLVGLAVANLALVLVARFAAAVMLRPVTSALSQARVGASAVRSVLSDLWPNAWRLGVVALSAFAITRSNMLVISSFVGLESAAAYGITLQLLGALAAVAQLPTTAALPRIIALRVRGDFATLRRMVLQRHLFLVVTMVGGSIALIVAGQPLLTLLGSTVRLLPTAELSVLALVLLLEANHSNAAVTITTGNHVPFVWPGILSGLAVLGLSIGATRAGYGVMSVILVQGLVQAAYNNWKWPRMLWKELNP